MTGRPVGASPGQDTSGGWKSTDTGAQRAPRDTTLRWFGEYTPDEAIYVLEGILEGERGDDTFRAGAGSFVFMLAV